MGADKTLSSDTSWSTVFAVCSTTAPDEGAAFAFAFALDFALLLALQAGSGPQPGEQAVQLAAIHIIRMSGYR